VAITERYTSRSQHITAEGTTLTQVFDCSDSDWNNWIALGKPIIGTQWSPDRRDLRVTDIRDNWLSNTHCEVYVTYSTRGMYYPQKRMDKLSSQREVFDFQYTPRIDPEFVDTDGARQNWRTIYNTWKSPTDENDFPPLYPDNMPLITVTASSNVSEWYWYSVKDRIGGVNDNNWISTWGRRWKPRERIQTSPIGDNDTGKWLFSGFHAEKVGYDWSRIYREFRPNYELTYTYIFYNNKWNYPYGHPTSIKLYPRVSFWSLPRPRDWNDDEDYSLR